MTTGKQSSEKGLDGADLAALSAALDEGKRPTVYLNDPVPGLGLPAGASAKVVAVDGTTVRVRPRGVSDELPFEAGELRASKAVRTAAKAGGRSAAKATAGGTGASTVPAGGKAGAVGGAGATAKPPARRAKAGGAVTITVSCDDAGGWAVSVAQGERRPGRPRPVTADAVEKAIAELGDPAAEAAVRAALDSARAAASRRVEELSRQLDEARSALEALR